MTFLLVLVLALLHVASAFAQATVTMRDSDRQVLSRSRDELHRWARHVRAFRREHNFAFVSGVSNGTWEVKKFNTLENRKYNNSGIFSRFQYSFHLQWYRGFGYLLGSTLGYHYESTDKRRPFKPVPAIQFPGLLAGIVFNLTPVVRLSLAGDVYLERHDQIEERDGVEEDREISITMRALDSGVYLDFFYDLSWALRIEAHARQVDFLRPEEPPGSDVDVNLRKTDQWLGVGLLYHLL